MPNWKNCRKGELDYSSAPLNGSLILDFKIDTLGNVFDVSLNAAHGKLSDKLSNCIRRTVLNIKFTDLRLNGPINVHKQFVFYNNKHNSKQ